MDNKEKSIIEELKEIQKSLPEVILPTMGILDNDNKLIINNENFINNSISNDKEN